VRRAFSAATSVAAAIEDAVPLRAMSGVVSDESLVYLRTLARSGGSAKSPGRMTPLNGSTRSTPRAAAASPVVPQRAVLRTASMWALPPEFAARFDIGNAIGEIATPVTDCVGALCRQLLLPRRPRALAA
jgi:hypothetical protein